MASTTTSSEHLTASEWTQQTLFSDLMQQKWLLVGAGAMVVTLWLLLSRRPGPQEKAARRLVRDWRNVDDASDVRDLLSENVPVILRPVLLSAVDEIEHEVHRWFRQVERDIQRL